MNLSLRTLIATAAIFTLCAGGAMAAEGDFPVVDALSGKKIASISTSPVSTLDCTGSKWYLLMQMHGTGDMVDVWTPARDAGDGEQMKRTMNVNAVEAGMLASHVARYLLSFEEVEYSISSNTETTVVNLKWGTGRYWRDASGNEGNGTNGLDKLYATSNADSIGQFNIYSVSSATYGDCFAVNVFDMGLLLNNGTDGGLITFNSGKETGSHTYGLWRIYEVTLADAADSDYDTVEDMSGMLIDSIGEAITTLPEDGQWYIMDNARSGEVPTYDNGEEENILRASNANEVQAGDNAADKAKYLVRFLKSDKEAASVTATTEGVYRMQWATGRYWEDAYDISGAIKSSSTSVGLYNVYVIAGQSSDSCFFAMNVYDMQGKLNSNAHGGTVPIHGTGETIDSLDSDLGNNIWHFYPVYLYGEDENETGLLELLNEAHAAYEANASYKKSETGFMDNDPIGNGLIRTVDQLYSPYTDQVASTQGGLKALIDNDSSTVWISNWQGGEVVNGLHYLQVVLPDDFVAKGGSVAVRIQLRGDRANESDEITQMSVKYVIPNSHGDSIEYTIRTLSFPYHSQGEIEWEGFTCPAGVKTLRFHEEATEKENRGYWHLGEFQLFETSLDDCANSQSEEADSTKTESQCEMLLDAINAAVEAETTHGASSADIAALSCAKAYYEEDGSFAVTWTMTEAGWGTIILPFEASVPEGLTAYICKGVQTDDGSTLDLEEITEEQANKFTANTPYIVSGTAGTYTFTGMPSYTQVINTDNTYHYLYGTYAKTIAEAGSYVMQDQGSGAAFYQVAENGGDIIVAPYHCYLTLPDTGGEAKAVVYFPGSGVATAIEAVDGITTDNEAIYDLSGRKVTDPRSGIYIKGGKKVIIK